LEAAAGFTVIEAVADRVPSVTVIVWVPAVFNVKPENMWIPLSIPVPEVKVYGLADVKGRTAAKSDEVK
jgi:hypothetical protein